MFSTFAWHHNDTMFFSFAWHFLETHGMLRWPFLVSADIEEYGHALSRPMGHARESVSGPKKKTHDYMRILRL